MDAKKLEILMTAVDLGSFSKASEVVGYTQSGLTHLVDSLEREIGFPLIRRSYSGIALTEAGENLLPDIRQFLQANATLENKIQAVREQQEESIRVAAYASIAMYWMPEILYRFRRLCPKVDVDLRMVDHALEPFELLQSGKTDVIFASRQKEPKCEWIPLYHELLYAILPKQYPLNGRKEFPLREFEGKDFLMPYGRFDIDVHAAFAKEGVRAKEQSVYVDDEKCQQEFMNIKYQNKIRLAKYIKEHNGIDVDPRSIFDVQVKRLHEYKRQLMNILHVMYLYNQLKDNPNMDIVPRTFIFGAKAAAGYKRAKLTIKLINNVADVINNDKSIGGKLKVVFIEDYRVSNAELIFSAADVSEQISTASKEASGTGNMKFMLNGALTIGTMDGANVEMAEEVGKENMFIFGASADEIINLENNGGYNPMDIFNNDQDIRRVLMQLINGYYSPQDPELFRDIYNSLLNTQSSDRADTYFILKDFRSYAEAHKKIDQAYRDEKWWARTAMLNTASAGKFSSDRTIEEYVRDIWHLEKIKVELK